MQDINLLAGVILGTVDRADLSDNQHRACMAVLENETPHPEHVATIRSLALEISETTVDAIGEARRAPGSR